MAGAHHRDHLDVELGQEHRGERGLSLRSTKKRRRLQI
jgi:hypothetical protein